MVQVGLTYLAWCIQAGAVRRALAESQVLRAAMVTAGTDSGSTAEGPEGRAGVCDFFAKQTK